MDPAGAAALVVVGVVIAFVVGVVVADDVVTTLVVGGWAFSPFVWFMSATVIAAIAPTPAVIAAATTVSLTFHLLPLDGLDDSPLGRAGSLLLSEGASALAGAFPSSVIARLYGATGVFGLPFYESVLSSEGWLASAETSRERTAPLRSSRA